LALTITLAVAGTILGAFFLWAAWMVDFRFTLRRPAKKARSAGPRRGYAPFRIGEGRRAVLLVHGIAGGPAQMGTLARGLAAEGFVVHVPLLPGHGTSPDDLFHITWLDWYKHVEQEFLKLTTLYDEVSVVGFSLGAALGVKLAAEHGRRMKRLVLISTPLYLFTEHVRLHWVLRLCGLFSREARTFPKRLDDPDGPEYMIYHRIPHDALWAVVDLIREVRSLFGRVEVPTLLFHSRRDVAARPRSARETFRALGSRWKRVVWLPRGRHGLMEEGPEEERQLVLRELARFLAAPPPGLPGGGRWKSAHIEAKAG